jgi:hypothetical protein
MTISRVGLTALALSALFSSTASAVVYNHEEFAPLVKTYSAAQADLLGSTVISSAQRIARLNGARGTDLTQGEVLGYMANIAPTTAAAAAVAVQASGTTFNPFGVWVDGSFAYLENNASTGRAMVGSAGVDYVVDDNLLVGAFIAVDRVYDLKSNLETMNGTGVMVGPYMTARLSQELTLDITAAIGAAEYTGTALSSEVTNKAKRAYFNATISGAFGETALRFTPRAGLTYTGEWTDGYDAGGRIDGKNDDTTTTVFVGPGVTYSAQVAGVSFSASVNADIKSTLGNGSTLSGAIEAAAKLGFDNGFGLTAAASHSGIGTSNRATTISLKASAGF